MSSVTDSTTLNVPAVVNVWDAVTPDAVPPSPKFQLYDTIERPAAALDAVPLNNTDCATPGAVGENTNAATGAGVGLVELTVTLLLAVPVCPRSSLTSRTALYVPADAKAWVAVTPLAVPPSPK